MALLARLFSPRKNNKKDKLVGSSSFNENKPYAFSIDKNDVRVLLFRECDWRGRKLLFDSTSVEKVALDPKTPISRRRSNTTDMIVEVSNGFGYKYKKPHADTNNLGETIFGSIAMLTRGPSIKIHVMKDPPRIMFTKVIQAPRSAVRKHQIQSDEKLLDGSQGSSINSIGEYFNSGSFSSKRDSFEGVLEDSGLGSGPNGEWVKCYSPQHCSCPLHPLSLAHLDDNNHTNSSNSLHSASSLSSLRRRWARSVATTLNFTDPITSQPATAHQPGKRTKLGIAVIVPLATSDAKGMEQFFLERMPQLNNILTRLQHSTERAYCRRDSFVQSMVQASCHASQSMCELVSRARLEPPLWLTLTTAPSPDSAVPTTTTDLATKLVADLIHLLNTLDTKNTNFFISTLLTAVLTNHLGWVPTVFHEMPPHTNSMLADLSKNHPYNPLWAQLSDLQGTLGFPPKIAKTVVVGKSEVLVEKLLSVLSYFIRCGHVKPTDLERDIPPDEENYLDHFINNEQEKTSFEKDAIREFSKAGSFEENAFNSTTTLTKSKTVLSMKTFCVTDCELDNTNSLESGFESCNDCSGESYEDNNKTGKPIKKLGTIKSNTKSFETSFSETTITNFPNEYNIKPSPSFSQSHLPMVKILENNQKDVFKTDNEKQFTSPDALKPLKRISSKASLNSNTFKNNFFTKENLMSTDFVSEDNEQNKVVFLLGENEELRNLKSQGDANIPQTFRKELSNGVKTPIILIDDIYVNDNLPHDERFETDENKAGFVAGDVNSRVVIVRSTPIKLEDATNSKLLKTNQLHRCLSVPEEAVSETAWVKRRRSQEAVELIRRWLSDSILETVTHKPYNNSVSENLVNCATSATITPASVFRTSNRTLKDTSVDVCVNESVELALSSNVSVEVPTVEVENVDVQPTQCEYTELPFQSSIEGTQLKGELGIAASLFAGLADTYSPEWVLQGVSQLEDGWATALRHSLALEAHSVDCSGGEVELTEAVCIVANTDTWEVLVVSSHSQMGEGVTACVGMSQLVANMLETVHKLSSLSVPPHQCLSHLETKLSEMCLRSQALSELLLASDFLDIATLTSALDLDANDVPLLLSIASTHTPLVTRKYGLSFQ